MAKWREMGYGDQRSPMLMELPKARGFNDPQYTRCIADGGGASILGSHEARAVVCDLTGLSRVRGRVDGHLVGVDCQIERSSSEGDAQCAATGLHDWKSPENGDRRVLQGPLVVCLIPLLSRAQASLTNAWAKTKNTTEARSVATESRKNSALLGAGGMCVGAAAAPLKKQETRGASRRPERDSRRKHTRLRRRMQGAAILCWRLTKRIKKPAKRIKDTPK